MWLGVQVGGLFHTHLSLGDNAQMAASMRWISGFIRSGH